MSTRDLDTTLTIALLDLIFETGKRVAVVAAVGLASTVVWGEGAGNFSYTMGTLLLFAWVMASARKLAKGESSDPPLDAHTWVVLVVAMLLSLGSSIFVLAFATVDGWPELVAQRPAAIQN